MPVKEVLTNGRVPVKIWTDEVDDKSRAQPSNIASLPFIHHHVAAMPDVHLGIPVVWNLAGGYQEPVHEVLKIHNATMRACIDAYL